jgi:hypothetical protein
VIRPFRGCQELRQPAKHAPNFKVIEGGLAMAALDALTCNHSNLNSPFVTVFAAI